MKAAILQPYFFPYLGYFQVLSRADVFVFYDDVHFITRGWINRNRILLQDKELLLTVPLEGASQNRQIRHIPVCRTDRRFQNLLPTIRQAYAGAPCFAAVYPWVEEVLESTCQSIGELAAKSVMAVATYLSLTPKFEYSSVSFPETRGMERAARLVEICKQSGADTYLNPIGGVELYAKEYFAAQGVKLLFVRPELEPYPQGAGSFVPGLSILDVLMHNSREDARRMACAGTLL